MDIVLTEKDVVRFWARVDRRGPDECWLWLAAKDPCGYGEIGINRRVERAHRVSYALSTNTQPAKLKVCHNCPGGDNPSCVNPRHLWLGTDADNMRDRGAKGRTNKPKGQANSKAKLTDDDIPVIRRKRKDGRTIRSLATEYRLNVEAISRLLSRKTWSHVP